MRFRFERGAPGVLVADPPERGVQERVAAHAEKDYPSKTRPPWGQGGGAAGARTLRPSTWQFVWAFEHLIAAVRLFHHSSRFSKKNA